MLLTGIAALLFGIGIALVSLCYDDFTEVIGAGLMATGGTVLFLLAILGPYSYYSSLAEVERYHALKDTIELSRTAEISDYERATLTQKVAEYNADIASVKYWNENVLFDDFIADELAELEPLK